MIDFTSGQLVGWVMSIFWPFVRLLAFVSTAPLFGENMVPRRIKIALAALLAFVIAPTLGPIPDVPPLSIAGVWLVVQQVMIGAALGLVMRLAFGVVQSTGEFIGMQMGLGFASFYSAALGANTMVLGQLLNTFAMLLFLAFNGHLILLDILARSFTLLPIGVDELHGDGWWLAARTGGILFTAGVSLALPLIATLLTINMAMGILNRASPQLSIFSIGFPMTLLAGLVVITFLIPDLGAFLHRLFDTLFERMLSVVGALAGRSTPDALP
ncbi:flagellar biosynthetic protein FliR [Salinisphaera sp. Q1T1-3]|uniref:flagellar biosynthetic protein FliR n=1 Tax=Salinisphaera sp. Q1T1-3 TaxID=2321229 RepID=UPI000E75C064|nr:flagellar biosynthetic protein FliR [Salinisphaera sp. Q1T1-3]RJS95162.1 flagellar biosynthetic protein FliR [Salinisphaera sp. Q1T1-3]